MPCWLTAAASAKVGDRLVSISPRIAASAIGLMVLIRSYLQSDNEIEFAYLTVLVRHDSEESANTPERRALLKKLGVSKRMINSLGSDCRTSCGKYNLFVGDSSAMAD